MDNLERAIARWAKAQHSLVTMAQLSELGLDRYRIEYRVRAGKLEPALPGVYRLPGVRPYFEQNVLAACLATGGVASHRSAAALFKLRGIEPGRIEVSVSDRRASRLPGITAHEVGVLDQTSVGVIPVTSPMQTLLHLAGVEPRLAEGALADAVARGLVRVPALTRYLRDVGRRGRNGTGRLRELVEPYVMGMEPTESWLEDRVVEFLRRYGFPEPVRQYPLLLPGRTRPSRLDLAYPQEAGGVPLDIEVDGRLWHFSPAQLRADQERDRLVVVLGWEVIRVTWLELVEEPERLAGTIAQIRGVKLAA
jgi:hypothetical protein